MTRHRVQKTGPLELARLDEIQTERHGLMLAFRDLLLLPDVHEKAADDGALFARLIRTAVLEYGIKQTVLAKRIRHSSAAVSRWMNDLSLPPEFTREGVLRAIARLIDEGLERPTPRQEPFGTVL